MSQEADTSLPSDRNKAVCNDAVCVIKSVDGKAAASKFVDALRRSAGGENVPTFRKIAGPT